MLTYKQVCEVFAIAEKHALCLRDALFKTIDLDELGLNEAQKLACAGSREVFPVARPELKKASDEKKRARENLDRLTGAPSRKKG
jgi:hypothetical protein